MNRLTSELQRLYFSPALRTGDIDPINVDLIDSNGQVRAMVLELARPAEWEPLAKVWRGVQADLSLPAPAIAVSGTDGYQLWFSLSQALPVAQAAAFLESLRLRYLSDIASERVVLMPLIDPLSAAPARHAKLVPALQAQSGNWSAFLAPDLAPVFADEPWLDIPPNPVGQSDLLSRHDSIQSADLHRAWERLHPATGAAKCGRSAALQITSSPADVTALEALEAASAPDVDQPNAAPQQTKIQSNPKHFLLAVMNNEVLAMDVRIDAAKALLPYFDDRRSSP